jgi:predicted LPLAT superfamily acyltransferase
LAAGRIGVNHDVPPEWSKGSALDHPVEFPATGWAAQPERGGQRITRAAVFVALRGGRLATAPLVWGATAWYLLAAGAARAASRDYLRRVLGRPARLADVARHFLSFAHAVLDRALLLGGRDAGFLIRTEGVEALLAILAQGRGCILLGAHLGSFEVLRTVARQAPVPVWALMYRHNAGAMTRLLDRLAPGLRDRVLEIGDTASMIRARECLERGEMVGILGDRAPPGHRMVSVPFLGAPASFPSGPFVLASLLGAPVVLFRAVRTGPRQYDVRFEPFADRIALRRGARDEDLRAAIGCYAAALEAGCRTYPLQWFNFFRFWGDWDGSCPEGSEAVSLDAGS